MLVLKGLHQRLGTSTMLRKIRLDWRSVVIHSPPGELSSARAGARESCADFRAGVWDFNFKPKTGVVLSLLLDLPRLPARPALWIVYHTYKLLKSQSGTRKGCGAPGWTTVPPPSANWTPKILGCMPNSMLFRPAFHSQNQQQRDRRSQFSLR